MFWGRKAAGVELTELITAGRWKRSSMPTRYTERQAAARGVVARYYQRRGGDLQAFSFSLLRPGKVYRSYTKAKVGSTFVVYSEWALVYRTNTFPD